MTPENNSQQGAKWEITHQGGSQHGPFRSFIQLGLKRIEIVHWEKSDAQQIIDGLNEREADKQVLQWADNWMTEYLCVGGMFNPELMEHDKVGKLIFETRDKLRALLTRQPK